MMWLSAWTYSYSEKQHAYWPRSGRADTVKPLMAGTPDEALARVRHRFCRKRDRWVLRVYDTRKGDTPGLSVLFKPSQGVYGVRITTHWRGPQQFFYTPDEAIELWLAHANMLYAQGAG